MPHSFDEERQRRYIASSKYATSELFKELEELFKQRELELEQEDSLREKSVKLPYYLFVISSSDLLEGESIAKYLLSNNSNLGVGVLMLFDDLSMLPKDCSAIIEVKNQKGVIYNTTNEKEPDNTDAQYRGGIKIENNVHVKFRGYNPAGDFTDVFEADYIIDPTLETQIKEIISTAQSEMDKTEVGTEIGNCIEGAKENLQKAIEKGNRQFNRNAVSVDDGTKIYESLNKALEEFRNQIIVPTERGGLEKEINKAEKLVETAVEGNAVGQYRNGAKSVLNADISIAKETLENLVARQEDIDNAKKEMSNAISRFEAKKITEIDKIIEETGAKIGPVTVSLLWNTNDDIDLHVTSPNGDTINYNNKTGRSGGRLDVDRQVNSFVENPVENIYWSNPPHGTYTVKVNMYSKRTDGNVPFRIRTIVNGEAKIYNMTINDGMTTVCTFTY